MMRFSGESAARFSLRILLAGTLLAAAAGMWGCSGGGKETGTKGTGDSSAPSAPAAATRYQCPMHPAMISDKPGDCPICGMTMIPIKKPPESSSAASPAPAVRMKIVYRSTMNPNEISDKPGKDSMGMEMERVEMEEGPGAGIEGRAAVVISSRKQQLIGVRSEPVKRVPFIRTIRAAGRVTVDESRLHHIHSKVEGWVENLRVDAIGQHISRGQPILSLYSPEILATQEEYLLALKARRELGEGALPETLRQADELVASGRRRLSLYDLTSAQIEKLETSGTPSRTVEIYSPVSGHVLQKNISHGEKITPEMNLLDIADLSRVWVIASVYEYELPFVKAGQEAVMTLSYLPGKSYLGKVAVVLPVLDSATRTIQVRLEFQNPGLDLKPEMYADVELKSDLGKRLAVPESAVIASGARNVVFVAQGDGYFQPREVRLGLRLDDVAEVLGGLAEGEKVVTSGSFLIDSESSLKAALEAAGARAGPGPESAKPAKEP